MRTSTILTACILGIALAACSESRTTNVTKASFTVPAPMTLTTSAYEAASKVVLDDTTPYETKGLHNVYALSDDIISGAEPEGEDALIALAEMGIKTILSVDGKAPDAQTAKALGMRYVHIPIQYKGITDDEVMQIAKTFHELEAPFYVHCYHGVHRGPAAAAIGRVAFEGTERDHAIAEMRQWCGTSPKYEGLYATIAAGNLPSPEETAAYEFDFPEQRMLSGIRQSMIHMARSYDRIKAMVNTNGAINPDHPDIDPVNEAAILTGLFEQSLTLDRIGAKPDDYRGWLADSVVQSQAMHEALIADRTNGAESWDTSREAFTVLKASCDACHAAYRNDDL